jgi:hypothetical protein
VSYPDAFARYEALRPVLTGERSLRQQSHQTGINDWRLWRDLRRVRRDGLLGLLDRRALPHARGKPAAHSAACRATGHRSGAKGAASILVDFVHDLDRIPWAKLLRNFISFYHQACRTAAWSSRHNILYLSGE